MTNDMLDGAVAKSVAEKLIGLDVSEANKLCADSKCIVRVSCIDNVHQVMTCDYDEGRINLTIEEGRVVKASVG